MLTYMTRRAFYGLLVLLGVNLLTFFLFFTVNTPDDMARLNIGGKRVTQEQIDKWKAERGYDKPLYFDATASGSDKLTRTIFWERSVSLFALRFGRADGENSTARSQSVPAAARHSTSQMYSSCCTQKNGRRSRSTSRSVPPPKAAKKLTADTPTMSIRLRAAAMKPDTAKASVPAISIVTSTT